MTKQEKEYIAFGVSILAVAIGYWYMHRSSPVVLPATVSQAQEPMPYESSVGSIPNYPQATSVVPGVTIGGSPVYPPYQQMVQNDQQFPPDMYGGIGVPNSSESGGCGCKKGLYA